MEKFVVIKRYLKHAGKNDIISMQNMLGEKDVSDLVCIQGLQKVTLLDVPGKVACTVFTGGCNFRCPFCQNSDLLACAATCQYSEDELLTFLEGRKKLLDAVCVSGGEPLLQADLPALLRKIKAMGYYIKLDTNGSFPDRLKTVVEEGLVDYVAMDLKNSTQRYSETIGMPPLYQDKIEESIDYLLSGVIPYEFRTTVVRELHDQDSLLKAAQRIKGAEHYYLQQFVDSDHVLKQGLSSYSPSEMEALRKEIAHLVPNVQLRGCIAEEA